MKLHNYLNIGLLAWKPYVYIFIRQIRDTFKDTIDDMVVVTKNKRVGFSDIAGQEVILFEFSQSPAIVIRENKGICRDKANEIY